MYNTTFRQKKRRKSRLLAAGIFLILLAAAGGVLYRLPISLQDISRILQLAAGKTFQAPANKIVAQKSLRGIIYDRNFNELAVSYPLFSLFVHPAKNSDHSQAARKLADIIQIPEDKLERRFKGTDRVVQLADDLDRNQVRAVERLHLDGIFCKRSEVRYYPENEAAATIIGYTGNGVGLSGVEKKYDLVLRPGGYRAADLPEVRIDDKGVLGRKGSDLILTLDLALQKRIDTRLQELLHEQDGARGMALLLEPSSGKVLASSSQPSFNPNYFWKTGAAGRHDRIFQPLFPIDCLRPLLTRVAAIIIQGEESVPLLPVTIAARDFGLDNAQYKEIEQALQISHPVADGLLMDTNSGRDDLEEGNKQYLSLMQVGVGLAELVNGGWRHRPVFLDSVYDVEKGHRFHLKKTTKNSIHVLSPTQGVRIRRDLATHFSSSKKKKSLIFTAKNSRIEPVGTFGHYVQQQIFVGMIPGKKPELLLVMAIERDQLAPRVKRKKPKTIAGLGNSLLMNLYTTAAREHIAEFPHEKNKKNFARFLISRRMEYSPLPMKKYTGAMEMPKLVGLSLRKGLQQLNGRKLHILIEGTGRIVSQSPAPGARLQGVKACRLRLDSRI